MPNPEGPGTAPSRADEGECLGLLTAGLSAYLEEIDGYRAICRRHEGAATVDGDERELRVTRYFAAATGTVAHFRAMTLLLPHQDCLVAPRCADTKGRENPPCLVSCDTIWEGRRLLIRAFEHPSPPVLQVELSLGPRVGALPELPLRAVATALRCHEFLLPAGVARPLPSPHDPRHARQGIRAYLTQQMPPNLHASQCI